MSGVNEYFKEALSTEAQNKMKHLYARGKTMRDIAKELGVSLSTVQKYVGSAYNFTPEQIEIAIRALSKKEELV